MIRSIAAFFTLLTVSGTLLAAPADFVRARYNFNSDWLLKVSAEDGAEAVAFKDTSAEWLKVTLPHAWNEDSAFKVSIDKLPTGVAWYRKHFKLPPNSADKKVFLEFEGIRQGGEFYLNGEWIGRSENGVMAFGFDVSDKVKPAPAENVIAARIDNAWNYHEHDTKSGFQWSDRNFYANYGGINKNVYLHITDKLYQTLPLYSNLGTTGVYVQAEEADVAGKAATIRTEAQVKNERTQPQTVHCEVRIKELDGRLVAQFQSQEETLGIGETKLLSASARVIGLNFWSWAYGYLYNVTTTLKVDGKAVDVVNTRTGFRRLEFGHGMVKLNERTIQIKGYAQRSTNEWPAVGQCVPPWMSDFSNALAVESGANLIRWMHVTPQKQDVASLDRVGLMQAMPAGDSEREVTGRRWEQRVELMRDAIIYNRNSPSIICYECGNNGISEEHMAEMKAVRDRYDPNGGRAIGAREMMGSKEAEYGGEMLYINKSAHIPLWATEYSRDEGLRKYWDDWSPPFHKDGVGPDHQGQPALIYNRNQDTHAVENVVRWYDYWRERPGTGERVSAGGVNIYFSDSNTHYRGAANYRCSGEVDAMRLPKQGFYAHQVMWDGWVNVEHPRVHLIGHWNYDAKVVKPVSAVSSAEKVALFLNGKSKGFGVQSERFLFTWNDISYEPGELKAVGYDADGKALCEASLLTAGAPAQIRLTPHTGPGGMRADGADMALVDVEVVDENGKRCPTALNEIHFTLHGPAEWRGGIAVGENNFILSKILPVEGGVNRVILRSLSEAGKIVLDATSEGLPPARIELTSLDAERFDGLSTTFPDAGLAPQLARGPTPAGDSIVITRRPAHIVSVTAGANADQAAQSYDDNEETKWKNDGKRATAWIEYQLEHPATVHEIVLKLGGWRKSSYPLRITVDGVEAYAAATPKSLGYVTLSLKPTKGSRVRIELVGAVTEKDAFGIVEITGEKLADSTSSNSKGTLEIIEAEIYAPLVP